MRERLKASGTRLQPLLIMLLLVMGCHQSEKIVTTKAGERAARALSPAVKESAGDAAKRALAKGASEREARRAAVAALDEALKEGKLDLPKDAGARIERAPEEAERGEAGGGEKFREKAKERARDCVIECLFKSELDEVMRDAGVKGEDEADERKGCVCSDNPGGNSND